MFIPIGTDRALRRPARVTHWLIGLNVLIFLATTALDRFNPELHASVYEALWITGGSGFRPWQLISSAFLHGGLLHLLGNMLFLWTFGPNLEDKLRRAGYLAFYLLAASASAGLHALFEDAPAVGASGAIAGVTGAYLIMFPRTMIRVLVFFFIIGVFAIQAWWFIAFQIAWNLLSFGVGADRGVAFLAHLGGYGFGIAVAMVLLGLRIVPREPYDLFTAFSQARRREALRQAHEIAERRQRRLSQGEARRDPRAEARADKLAEARGAVNSAMARGDLDLALSRYRDLLEEFGAKDSTLARQTLADLAAHATRVGEHALAATAYEKFLERYSSDREAPVVRVMLGLINARYLNDPVRAGVLLNEARASGLLDEGHARIADALLEELGGAAAEPARDAGEEKSHG